MDYKQSAADIAAELGSDINTGLSIKIAHERIHSRGRNAIRVPKVKSTFAGIWHNTLSVMNIVLILMAVIHLVALKGSGIALSVCFIACAVINAAVGYISFRRSSAINAAAISAQEETVRVIRSGIENTAIAPLLAQGDVILLKKGQTVPADAKIIECDSLVVDESIINGDGTSVTKSARYGIEDESITVLYMGTKILDGSVKAIITDVGTKTQLGGIVNMLGSRQPRTSAFAKRISAVGNICGAAAAVMWAVALIMRLSSFDKVSAFDNSISAAITAIPVSLSAVLLITMILDVFRLRKNGIDIGSISAVEAMGATTVLCVGKRGVITEPGFTVGEVSPQNGFDPNGVRLMAAMCTTADLNNGKPRGDSMQVALIEDALSNGISPEAIRSSSPMETILDNRSSKRIMTSVHKTSSGYTIISKGSPDAVLSCCSYIFDNGIRLIDPQKDIAAVIGESHSMAERALTVIGVAYKEVSGLESDPESGLTFVGLVGLSNPVRKDSAGAVRALGNMGVRTCIITDDNLTSASAVAEDCGISRGNVLQGSALDINNLDRIRKNTVYADTPPSMKADIVAAVNAGRESVTCVGRGAKDINAMGRAEVSIATDAGARVCSAAADVHVSGSGLGVIAAAIRECKRSFINNDRMIGFMLSCNMAEMVCAIASLAMGYAIPFTPFGIIWLNAVIATIGAIAIWREPYHRPRLHGKKELRSMKKGSLAGSTILGAMVKGLLMGAAAIAVYASSFTSLDISERRGAVFFILCVSFTLMAQSCRSDEMIYRRLNNKAAWICLALGAAAALFAMTSAFMRDILGIGACYAVGAAGLAPFVLAELFKLFGVGKTRKGKKNG